MTSRRPALALLSLALLPGLAACGSSSNDQDASSGKAAKKAAITITADKGCTIDNADLGAGGIDFTVKNVDAKAKTLIIEHPVRGGYKLLGAKPVETTPAAYRFEVKLAPNAEVKFPVDEEYVFNQTFEVMNMTPDMLVVYLQNRTLSDAGRRALNAISDRKHDIAVCDSEVERLQSESAEVERDQSRVRQNISSLNSVSGQEQQVRQYSQQLAAGESRIVAIRDQVNQQRIRKQQLQKALNDLIEKTVF